MGSSPSTTSLVQNRNAQGKFVDIGVNTDEQLFMTFILEKYGPFERGFEELEPREKESKSSLQNNSSLNIIEKTELPSLNEKRTKLPPLRIGKTENKQLDNVELPRKDRIEEIVHIDEESEEDFSPTFGEKSIEVKLRKSQIHKKSSFEALPTFQQTSGRMKINSGESSKLKRCGSIRGVEFSNTTTVRREDGTKHIDEYEIQKKIGMGMYGKVKKGVNRFTGKEVAIKILDKTRLKKFQRKQPKPGQKVRGRRPGFPRRPMWPRKPNQKPKEPELPEDDEITLREVAILKRIRHENVVRLYKVIDVPEKNKIYLVYEFVRGGAAMEIDGKNRSDRPPFPEETCRRYFRDLIKGLEYLHAMNIIHRDIKTENLLVDENGTLKITDFGVSKMHEPGKDILRSSGGTTAYLPPEACKSGEIRGKPFDIWTCGITLYAFLFGKLPFFSNVNVMAIYGIIRNSPVEYPEGYDVSENLLDLFSKILEKDPEKRIKMEDLKVHPWVTKNGEDPLINSFKLSNRVTEDDIKNAVTQKHVTQFILAMKIKLSMKDVINRAKLKVRMRKQGNGTNFSSKKIQSVDNFVSQDHSDLLAPLSDDSDILGGMNKKMENISVDDLFF